MGEKIAPSKENSDNQGKIMNEMLTGATENPTGEENMDANSESNDNNTNDEPNEEEDNSGDMSPEGKFVRCGYSFNNRVFNFRICCFGQSIGRTKFCFG